MTPELQHSRHPYYIRNLHQEEPDDFEYPAWDVVLALPGGRFIYSTEIADSLEEAARWVGDNNQFDNGVPGDFVRARNVTVPILQAVIENRKKVAEWAGLHYAKDFPRMTVHERAGLEQRYFEMHNHAAV